MEDLTRKIEELQVEVTPGCSARMKVRCALYGTKECPDKSCTGYLTCPSSIQHSDR